MPPKPPRKEDYWLTRKQVAERIRAARRLKLPHVARLLLIGVYTGTRPGAILGLSWPRNTRTGYFDLERRIIHRKAIETRETKTLQPKARIHDRLYLHLIRWQKADAAAGGTHVITFKGVPMKKFRPSWVSVAIEAGHAKPSPCNRFWIVDDGPHILRHTAVTWHLQAGISYHETAGFVGMSAETIEKHYGHHSPDFQRNAATTRHRLATG